MASISILTILFLVAFFALPNNGAKDKKSKEMERKEMAEQGKKNVIEEEEDEPMITFEFELIKVPRPTPAPGKRYSTLSRCDVRFVCVVEVPDEQDPNEVRKVLLEERIKFWDDAVIKHGRILERMGKNCQMASKCFWPYLKEDGEISSEGMEKRGPMVAGIHLEDCKVYKLVMATGQLTVTREHKNLSDQCRFKQMMGHIQQTIVQGFATVNGGYDIVKNDREKFGQMMARIERTIAKAFASMDNGFEGLL